MYRYWFSEPSRRPELKGNPVRIRNSARCCKSLSFGRNGSSALFATGFYREGAVNGTSQKTCRNNDWILYLRDTGANRTAGIRRPVQPISLAFPGNKSATKKSSEPDDERSETNSIHFGEGGGVNRIFDLPVFHIPMTPVASFGLLWASFVISRSGEYLSFIWF